MPPNLLSEIQVPNILEISSIHHSINVLTDKGTVLDIYPKNMKNLIQGVFRKYERNVRKYALMHAQ